jgi:hypoxanthine phosphoribosyltransferase
MLPKEISSEIENAIVNGMRRNKDDRTQSVELLADALKLDISTVDSEIPDDFNITKPINTNRDFAKIFKFAGIILALAVFIGGIIWLVSNSNRNTSNELEQKELLTNDTIVSTRDSISQLTKEADKVKEQEQETKQAIQPAAPQAADNNAPKQSDSNAKLVSSAKNIAEMRSLANKNIPESYAPLSKMEFDEGNYDAAAKYAQMAQNAGQATNASRKVLQELTNMGY